MTTNKSITIKGTEYTPINRQAGLVTSPNPNNWYEIRNLPNCKTVYDAPPPTLEPMPLRFSFLLGTRRGSMVIIKYHKRSTSHKTRIKFLFVARCDCGKYELRSANRWIRALNKGRMEDACEYCKRNPLTRDGEKE
jgi:hypothetical protein